MEHNSVNLNEGRASSNKARTQEDAYVKSVIASQFRNVGMLYLESPLAIDGIVRAFRKTEAFAKFLLMPVLSM